MKTNDCLNRLSNDIITTLWLCYVHAYRTRGLLLWKSVDVFNWILSYTPFPVSWGENLIHVSHTSHALPSNNRHGSRDVSNGHLVIVFLYLELLVLHELWTSGLEIETTTRSKEEKSCTWIVYFQALHKCTWRLHMVCLLARSAWQDKSAQKYFSLIKQ